MERVEPLEMILPGVWKLSFLDDEGDPTGEGEYTFKLAGTYNADVRDVYSGHMTLYGYWQVEDARLMMRGQEVTSRCSSCLGAGTSHHWVVELEQVHDTAFTGMLLRPDENQQRLAVFERLD